MDQTVRAFVEAVKEKQKRIVLDVATERLGRPAAEVEEALKRRLSGTGATEGEIARWAAQISATDPAAHGR